MKTGTNCLVRLCHRQWFYRSCQWMFQWELWNMSMFFLHAICSLKCLASFCFSQAHKRNSNRKESSFLSFGLSINLNERRQCSEDVMRIVVLLFSRRCFVYQYPLIPISGITTEGGIIWRESSSPFSRLGRCVLDPVVDPANPVVVASQTRLDGSRTDLCRWPWRLVFTRISTIPTNTMSWRPLWCRHDRLGSTWWSESVPDMLTLSFGKQGRIFWKLEESPKKPQKQGHKTSVELSNLWKSAKIDSLFFHSLIFHSPNFHLPDSVSEACSCQRSVLWSRICLKIPMFNITAMKALDDSTTMLWKWQYFEWMKTTKHHSLPSQNKL